MDSEPAFPPPSPPHHGPFGALEPQVSLYLRSDSPDAQLARDRINSWYAAFPGQGSTFLARLRHTDDGKHYSAVDELFTYSLLSQRFHVAYEEQAAVAKPTDLRLYTDGTLAASVEVLSLFIEPDWNGDLARNGLIQDALNKALPLGGWYLGFHVYQWNPRYQPSFKPIIGWLREQIDSLPAPSSEPPATVHYREYRDKRQGLRIVFSFLQRVSTRPPQLGDRIVAWPGSIGGFGGAIARLRAALDKKVTKRYDLQGQPFVIVVSNHDFACDSDDIHQAVYGHGGFFTQQPDGRIYNTRVSAVYVLHRWAPWHQQPPQILELRNPHAHTPLPKSIFETCTPIPAPFVSVASPGDPP